MDALTPLTAFSLRQRVYLAVQQAIVAGELVPGARLRDQDLAARLGVSRTPVREALQQLEVEGLVETTPHAATRVTALGGAAARDAFPVVAALHALATRLAVPRLTAADVAAMAAANREFAACIADARAATISAVIAADDRFHAVLLRAGGNSALTRTLAGLMPQVRRLEYARFASLAGRTSVAQHQAILAACEQGDATAAAALVEENWLNLGRLIGADLEYDSRAATPHSTNSADGPLPGEREHHL